jgi:hypothetical protein
MLHTQSRIYKPFALDADNGDAVRARLLSALCGLIVALLFFTAAPTGAGEINSIQRSATFSVVGPEISFTAVRLLGLPAH